MFRGRSRRIRDREEETSVSVGSERDGIEEEYTKSRDRIELCCDDTGRIVVQRDLYDDETAEPRNQSQRIRRTPNRLGRTATEANCTSFGGATSPY